MFELLFDWNAAMSYGTDVLVYLLMALFGTVFFMLRLLFALFFGGDLPDMDSGDIAPASDSSFSFFSLLSVLAFFMGAGWMGLTCRIDWDMSSFAAAASAAGFGFAMMMLASGLMMYARRLDQSIEYDLNSAVGKTGRVYMSVPKQGAGRGQVEVNVSGRRKVLAAVSAGDKLSEFSSVRIDAVRDDGTLIVSPLD